MICYLDKTFCSSDCTKEDCHRFLSDEVREGSIKRDLPIAQADFSEDCDSYEKPIKLYEGCPA